MKSKGIKYLFLWLSFLLVLGHSIAPHCHYKENGCTAENDICADESDESCLFDFIFALDLGEGHLDNFKPAATDNTEIAAPVFAALINIPTTFNFFSLQKEAPVYVADETPLPKPIRITCRSLRAPPATV